MHNWIRKYLEDRQQQVVLKGSHSKYVSLSVGIQYGSILETLFILLYINNLPDNIMNNIRIYADDVSHFIDYDDTDEGKEDLQREISQVERWAEEWIIDVNLSKTEALTFSRRRNIYAPALYMKCHAYGSYLSGCYRCDITV